MGYFKQKNRKMKTIFSSLSIRGREPMLLREMDETRQQMVREALQLKNQFNKFDLQLEKVKSQNFRTVVN